MKRIATLVLGVATMLVVANASFATTFPNVSCPDSVTIKQLWHGTNMGAPAPVCKPFAAVNTTTGSDTVMGIGGIVIGIDAIASAYGFYMQNTGGLDSMGIDVFTGAKNLVADWQTAASARLKADAAARALLSESISAIGRSSSQ